MIKKSDFFAFFGFFGYNKVEFIYNYAFMVEKENNGEFSENTKEKYWKLHDKTNTINNETDKIERHKHDFMNFCGQKRSLKKVRPGRTKLLSENSEQYASIQCKSGDCPEDETERNELRLERGNGESKNDDFEFNKPYRYNFSFRIPENFPLTPTRLVIGQWKFNRQNEIKKKGGPSPILAQRIKKINGKYYFIITNSHNKQIGKEISIDDIKGKWVDMEYRINFSDKEDIESHVEIIANIEGEGEQKRIDVYNGSYNIRDDENEFQLNPRRPHTGYFKFGLYRNGYKLAREKINKNYEETIEKINENKDLDEDRKQSKINQAEEKKNKDLSEIEQTEKIENENPMEIHFKNFSMEDLTYEKLKEESDKTKKEQQSLIGRLKAKLFK